MTNSNAIITTAIACNFPDRPGEVVKWRVTDLFTSGGNEIFPVTTYELTLDANGEGTQLLPVPDNTGTLAANYDIGVPSGQWDPYAIAYSAATQQLSDIIAAGSTTTAPDDIVSSLASKANKVTGGIEDNLTSITADGDIQDSGSAVADFEPALGNPVANDYVLASQTDGTRSWAAVGGGSSVPLAGGTMTGPLDFSGTDHEGVSLINLTTAQRDAIVAPSTGAHIWNTDDDAIEVFNGTDWHGLDVSALSIQIRNDSGGVLTAGTPVYITGYNAGLDLITVGAADASSAATMPAAAVVETASIANNGSGQAIIMGSVDNLNTSAFTAGDELYVSETAGQFTATRPAAPAISQSIAVVLRSHATLGIISVYGAGVVAVSDVDGLATTGLTAANMLRVAAAGGLEERTPANVLSDIGAEAAGAAAARLPLDAAILSKSATYQLAAGDEGKIIECNGTFTVTCPNSLDAGFQVAIVNVGTGTITIAAATTLQSDGTQLATQYTAATVYHRGSNVWLAFGRLT